MTFLWLLIFSAWSIANCVKLDDAKDDLEESLGKIVHASVVFRHGHRTPSFTYTKLGDRESYWREGPGQLTKTGKQVMYGVGKWLKERYQSTELNEGYRYDRVRVDSSDTDRTLESAELVLAGLFPPKEEEIWDDEDNLNWQPISVHTKPTKMDEMIYASARCNKYYQEYLNEHKSDRWTTYYNQNKQLFNLVADEVGIEIPEDKILKAVENVGYVMDAIKILRSYNVTIPDWAQKITDETINSIMAESVRGWVSNEEMRRMKVGPLLGSFVTDMRKKSKKQTEMPQFLHFYSGHDFTIGSILITFDAFDHPVPYGAALLLELRVKDNEYYVSTGMKYGYAGHYSRNGEETPNCSLHGDCC